MRNFLDGCFHTCLLGWWQWCNVAFRLNPVPNVAFCGENVSWLMRNVHAIGEILLAFVRMKTFNPPAFEVLGNVPARRQIKSWPNTQGPKTVSAFCQQLLLLSVLFACTLVTLVYTFAGVVIIKSTSHKWSQKTLGRGDLEYPSVTPPHTSISLTHWRGAQQVHWLLPRTVRTYEEQCR